MTTTATRWLLLLCAGVALWLAAAASGARIRAAGRFAAAAKAARHRAADEETAGECKDWTVELLLLYDLSGSYADDVAKLAELTPSLFKSVEKRFEGAKFALATFSDKPELLVQPVEDACFKTHSPMTTNHVEFVKKIKTLRAQNSRDLPEAQLDGLFHGLKSSTVKWSSKPYDSAGHPILRVIIMATDAEYHVAGDAERKMGSMYKKHNGTAEPHCGSLDYPEMSQVIEAFEERQALPLFLIGEKDHLKVYEKLLATLGRGGSVQLMASDSSNIVETMGKGLSEICNSSVSMVTTTVLPPPGGGGEAEVGGGPSPVMLGAIASGSILAAAAVAAGIGVSTRGEKEPNDMDATFIEGEAKETTENKDLFSTAGEGEFVSLQ